MASQIHARDVVMVPDLTPAQAAKEVLGPIGAGNAVAIGKLVVDPLDHVMPMQVIPAIRLVGVNFGPGRDVVTDVGQG